VNDHRDPQPAVPAPAGTPDEDHLWSWAGSAAERDERIRHARLLVGLRLTAVRYYDIDYGRFDIAEDLDGPRVIMDEAEWVEPAWSCAGFHRVDYGVELETAEGRYFSVTWDPPGDREGIGLREVASSGADLAADSVAVWEVGRRSVWQGFLDTEITDVVPHYLPWDDLETGFWCPRITVWFGEEHVELMLGSDGADGELSPAADSVAVVFPPIELPAWVPSAPRGRA
jgi:hypothetical protein